MKRIQRNRRNTPAVEREPCLHPTVFNDMCGKCGVDLAKLDAPAPGSAAQPSYVSMIHGVPELRVILSDAQNLDKNEESHLLQTRKLRLLVDLDQTLIHTTNDEVRLELRDVFHFQLPDHGSIWYHTRLRPGTRVFLERISQLYQLHICTFGSRRYAREVAKQLDPSRKYFDNRILSRDECLSQNSKTANLKELFPNGDHMVCIIDDREDVWNYGPNLIQVKPYHFFLRTGDINAPPGFAKKEKDGKVGSDYSVEPTDRKEQSEVPKPEIPVDAVDSAAKPEIPVSSGLDTAKQDKKNIKEISDDLLLSDDDEDDDAESVSEEKANDGDSESSSDGEPTTTESETTDTSLKPGPETPPTPTPANSEPPLALSSSILPETLSSPISPEPLSTPILPEPGSSPILPETETLSEQGVENMETTNGPECEKQIQPVDPQASESNNASSATNSQESEVKKEDGELSDSSVSVVDTAASSSTIPEIPLDKTEQSTRTTDIVMDDDKDEDDYLLYLEDILKHIHEAFYKLYDETKERANAEVPDVKNVIPYVRRKVLKGCGIVFSGVVPMDHPLEKSRPYLVAQSLGAQVSDKIISPTKSGAASTSARQVCQPTTHVVAARLGTAKVNEARRYKGVHIVTPDWLWCCAERWERVEEKLFALCKKSNIRRHPPAHCSSPESSLGASRDGYEVLTPLESQDSDDAVFAVQSGSSTTPKNGQQPAARRGRTPSGRFMDTINPLFSFTMDDIESMGQEVDDICNESDSSSSSDNETEKAVRKKPKKGSHANFFNPGIGNTISQPITNTSSSSETSDEEEIEALRAAGLNPRKRRRQPKTETETEDEPLSARFRRGEPLPSDLDTLNLTNASTDEEEGDEMEENSWMARALEQELLGDASMDSSNSKSQDGF